MTRFMNTQLTSTFPFHWARIDGTGISEARRAIGLKNRYGAQTVGEPVVNNGVPICLKDIHTFELIAQRERYRNSNGMAGFGLELLRRKEIGVVAVFDQIFFL